MAKGLSGSQAFGRVVEHEFVQELNAFVRQPWEQAPDIVISGLAEICAFVMRCILAKS